MASKDAHIAKAEENDHCINFLMQKKEDHGAWIATIAFYEALHLIEAVFAHKQNRHNSTHVERNYTLARMGSSFKAIHDHFRELQNISENARYMKGNCFDFNEYYPPEDVENEILGHRLLQIKKQTSTKLGK